jgi:hypothetical protein
LNCRVLMKHDGEIGANIRSNRELLHVACKLSDDRESFDTSKSAPSIGGPAAGTA